MSYTDRTRLGLQDLLRQHQIDGVRKLVHAYREDSAFRARWHEIWLAAARDDGGKLSFTAAGAILGAVLGGVGIAALGTAIGLPLLAVLGLGGLVAGTEVDAAVRRWWGEVVAVDIPKQLHKRLASKAEELGVEPRTLLAQILDSPLPRHELDGPKTRSAPAEASNSAVHRTGCSRCSHPGR